MSSIWLIYIIVNDRTISINDKEMIHDEQEKKHLVSKALVTGKE